MRIVEFAFIAYPATDLARSRAFYEGILGLEPGMTFEEEAQFWVEYEIGPHTLGIGNEPFLKPSAAGPQLVVEVADFDDTIAHLKRHQVPFTVEPFEMPACDSCRSPGTTSRWRSTPNSGSTFGRRSAHCRGLLSSSAFPVTTSGWRGRMTWPLGQRLMPPRSFIPTTSVAGTTTPVGHVA